VSCADVDECADDNGGCAQHSTCQNIPGGYQCVCNDGYRAYGSQCIRESSIFAEQEIYE